MKIFTKAEQLNDVPIKSKVVTEPCWGWDRLLFHIYKLKSLYISQAYCFRNHLETKQKSVYDN